MSSQSSHFHTHPSPPKKQPEIMSPNFKVGYQWNNVWLNMENKGLDVFCFLTWKEDQERAVKSVVWCKNVVGPMTREASGYVEEGWGKRLSKQKWLPPPPPKRSLYKEKIFLSGEYCDSGKRMLTQPEWLLGELFRRENQQICLKAFLGLL